jgi:hypothetical protein
MQSNRAKTMPNAKARACSILAEFDHAQTELVGKAVILTNGIAGTVDQIWLDELHRSANFGQRSRGQVAGLNDKAGADGLSLPSWAGIPYCPHPYISEPILLVIRYQFPECHATSDAATAPRPATAPPTVRRVPIAVILRTPDHPAGRSASGRSTQPSSLGSCSNFRCNPTPHGERVVRTICSRVQSAGG